MATSANPYQKAVAEIYGGGDYAHIAESEKPEEDAKNCGDTLFTFLMIELSEREGCNSAEDAIRRMEQARRDIDDAISALAQLED